MNINTMFMLIQNSKTFFSFCVFQFKWAFWVVGDRFIPICHWKWSWETCVTKIDVDDSIERPTCIVDPPLWNNSDRGPHFLSLEIVQNIFLVKYQSWHVRTRTTRNLIARNHHVNVTSNMSQVSFKVSKQTCTISSIHGQNLILR